MSSTPSPESDTPAPARRSLQTRGHITSYTQGRTCAVDDCDTTISRYNKADLCWKHAEKRDAASRHPS